MSKQNKIQDTKFHSNQIEI